MSAPPRLLNEIATSRAGDKGDDSLIAVYARPSVDVEELARILTPERIAAHFDLPVENVRIFGMREHGCLVIHLSSRLAGGVTRSTNADPHGKTLAFHLLDLPIEGPPRPSYR